MDYHIHDHGELGPLSGLSEIATLFAAKEICGIPAELSRGQFFFVHESGRHDSWRGLADKADHRFVLFLSSHPYRKVSETSAVHYLRCSTQRLAEHLRAPDIRGILKWFQRSCESGDPRWDLLIESADPDGFRCWRAMKADERVHDWVNSSEKNLSLLTGEVDFGEELLKGTCEKCPGHAGLLECLDQIRDAISGAARMRDEIVVVACKTFLNACRTAVGTDR